MRSSKHSRSTAAEGLRSRRVMKPGELHDVYRLLRQSFGHQKWWPGETPFEVIIGAILTQNTAWINVEKAILNLKQAGKLTPEAMHRLSASELAALIRPAGYFNVKALRIRNFMEFLDKEYAGDLARMFREKGNILRNKLLSISGIGPETADSILLYAAGKPFFVIDAYTKRIFSRHRLLKAEADYEEWRTLFTAALPQSRALFNDYHAQIVHTAKHFCRASQAHCEKCPLRIYL